MPEFHDRYEKCFFRFSGKLRHYHLAEVLSHVHPDYTNPNKIIYASTNIRVFNLEALIKLKDHMNKRLASFGKDATIKLEKEEQTQTYNLIIYPNPNSPIRDWLRQTEEIMCHLSPALSDFQVKNKH